MTITDLKQKLSLVALSIITTLILIEILLRILGGIHLFIQRYQNHAKLKNKATHKILCIGESTTYLGGKDSYPRQLERILNKGLDTKKFVVVNQGVPGIGTGYILAHIPEWIAEYQPDIVVSMMGINDHNKMIPVDQDSLRKSSVPFLKNCRLYKVAQWLIKSLSAHFSPPPTSPPSADRNKPQPTHDVVMDHLDQLPGRYRAFYNYGIIFLNAQQADKSERIFNALIEKDFNSVLNNYFHEKLGESLLAQHKYREATQAFAFLLKQNPYDGWVAEKIGPLCKNPKVFPIMLEFLEQFLKENPQAKPLHDLSGACYANAGLEAEAKSHLSKSASFRLENTNPVTAKNYLHLAAILKEKGIRAIFVQYPLRNLTPLQRYFAGTNFLKSVIFVDNESVFEEALHTKNYEDLFVDRFGGVFGHCTPEGNRILAENIAKAIREQVLP